MRKTCSRVVALVMLGATHASAYRDGVVSSSVRLGCSEVGGQKLRKVRARVECVPPRGVSRVRKVCRSDEKCGCKRSVVCGHLGLDWTLVRRLGQQARCRARRRKAESATTELLLLRLRPFTKTYNTSILKLNDNPTQRTVSIVRYVKRSRTLSKPYRYTTQVFVRFNPFPPLPRCA